MLNFFSLCFVHSAFRLSCCVCQVTWASTTEGGWITLLLQSYFGLFYFVAMDTTIQWLNLLDHLCSNLRCWQHGQTQLQWVNSECVLGSEGRPWAAACSQPERSESQFFTQGPGSAPYPIQLCPCLEEETAYGGKLLQYSCERYLALACTAGAQINWDVFKGGGAGLRKMTYIVWFVASSLVELGLMLTLIFANPTAEVQCWVNEPSGPGSRQH